MRCVRAHVTLYGLEEGRGEWHLPAQTRSLLFVFDTDSDEERMAGATLDARDRQQIKPGDSFDCTLTFWAEDEVAPYVQPGANLRVWYRTIVGEGRVAGPC